MTEPVDWLENHPESPYRFNRDTPLDHVYFNNDHIGPMFWLKRDDCAPAWNWIPDLDEPEESP